jgi:hypothetical protein
VSLVANHLEGRGITTVIIGSARDVVEECGAPRFVFTDHPLGNPMGRPGDAAGQRAVLELALAVAASAVAPRTTVQAPSSWGDDTWREDYMAIRDREALARAGEARRAARNRV